jgi:flagellar motility protein MotE (MotC chaperone)
MCLRKVFLKRLLSLAIFIFLVPFPLLAMQIKEQGLNEKINQFNNDKNKTLDSPLEMKNPLSQNFTQAELTLLKHLSERRKALEIRAKKIEEKEKVLAMIEKNIERKIKHLEVLKNKISKTTKEKNAEEKEQIKSFVKIYENMPAKNVAVIFNDMELDLLAKIIGSMREIKASGILANMDVKKARDISIKLSNKAFNTDQIK